MRVIPPSQSSLTGVCIVAEHPKHHFISREPFGVAQDKLRDREILDSSRPLDSGSERHYSLPLGLGVTAKIYIPLPLREKLPLIKHQGQGKLTSFFTIFKKEG